MPKDLAEAVKWYRKAADQGNPNGQLNLGVAYSNGDAVSEDSAGSRLLVAQSRQPGNAEV